VDKDRRGQYRPVPDRHARSLGGGDASEYEPRSRRSRRLGSARWPEPEANCRDEVAASLAVLWDRTGQQVFTVREVYAEMLAAGTRYAESTVFKTMQRMKAPAGAAPWIVLEQTGAGFRASTQT